MCYAVFDIVIIKEFSMFVKFPKIVAFNAAYKNAHSYFNATGEAIPNLQYRGKIKLHGTNAGVSFFNEQFKPQKRTSCIDMLSDNLGFATWTTNNTAAFKQMHANIRENGPELGFDLNRPVTVFGEWAGAGIQKGVALAQVKTKFFAIFAVCNGNHDDEDARLLVDPEKIRKLIGDVGLSNIDVIPWHGDALEVNMYSHASVRVAADTFNQVLAPVETVDPYVKERFGIEGPGEGFVYFPVNFCDEDGFMLRSDFASYAFKSKGEKHRVNASKSAVEISPEVKKSRSEFAEYVVTEARLEQALQEGTDGELVPKNIGPFLAWINRDIKGEIEAGIVQLPDNMDWKFAGKEISAKAREWFLDKVKSQFQ